mgnify:CR=1 FL=1
MTKFIVEPEFWELFPEGQVNVLVLKGINNFVDESLLGGLKLTYNNKVVDATIKAKLNAIKSKISSI